MSKYQPLSDRLRGHPADEWRASFTEIEDVLGFPLPKGARSGRAWWGNDDARPHSRAWASQGWQAHEVDPAIGFVTFRRGEISPAAVEAVAGLAEVGDLSGEAPPAAQPAPTPPSAALSAQPGSPEAASTDAPEKSVAKAVGMVALAAGAVAAVVGIGVVARSRLLRARPPSRKPLDIASGVRKGVDRLQRRS